MISQMKAIGSRAATSTTKSHFSSAMISSRISATSKCPGLSYLPTGRGKILWATDYPHPDGFFPGAPKMIAEKLPEHLSAKSISRKRDAVLRNEHR